ncbi:uncharacterized protein LOC129882343 isoform X1 [Solanum dulcamara]|uniref:uncharacterized protein LOC129882343 isoform X1 n=1 Tax=Solanum dulcamara TaxID=45834 RepID=UPI002485FA8C|nr:uncharacterized protein LOC129882343 isoform X1 [Solanum dulcamara]
MAAVQIGFDSENQEPKPNVMYLNYRRMPAVIFSKKYWDWDSMVAVCKLTMVGKFVIPKPKMTKIRVSFKAKIPLKGVVKIRSYDSYHVFLDFTNEEDYESVLLKEKVVVAGALMEVFRWTPEFHDQFRETFAVVELDNTKRDEHIGGGNEYGTEESDSVDCVPEVTLSDSEDRVASPIKCETFKLHSSVGISCSGFSGLSSAPYGITGRIPSVMYESSSMCSTDSVFLRETYLNHYNQKSCSREWKYGNKSTSEVADLACEALSQPLYALSIVERHENQKSRPPIEVQHSTYIGHPTVTFPRNYGESLVSDYKLTLIGNFSYRRPKMKDIRADFRAQNPLNGQVKIRSCTYRQVLLLFTNEEDYYTVLYKRMFIVAGALMQISWSSPDFHHEVKQNIHPDFRLSDANPVNWDTDTSKLHPYINGLSAPATDEKPMSLQVSAVSQCLSVPSIRPQLPLLAHLVSVAGRLCADPLITPGIYVPLSYPKGIVGSPIFGRNEQVGRGSTFPSSTLALDQHSLAQQHNQLNTYKEPNMTARIAQLQPPSTASVSDTTSSIRYRECLKNHAASMGGHVVDGCGEFMPSGGEGTPGAVKCAACNCHQNFHRKEIDDHQQMADVGSHSTFSQPENNSSCGAIQKQAPISLPKQQLRQYHHNYSNSCSPSSVVNSSQPISQPPSPKSGPVFSQQGLERTEPSSIRPSYSYEMVNHDTMQIGKQREYSWRDSSRNKSRDHPFIRNENWNFDIFKPLNTRTPSEFPACPSRCQSQSVFADEFPHLDIINNLLREDNGSGRTLMSNSGFQRLNNG